MGKIALRVIFLISLSLNLAFLALHLPGRTAKTASFAPEMQLSAAQVQQLQAVRGKTTPQYTALRERLAERQAQLINLLNTPQIDRPAVEECLAGINDLQSRLQKLAVEEIMQCKGVLDHKQCRCMLEASARRMGLSVCDGRVACAKLKK